VYLATRRIGIIKRNGDIEAVSINECAMTFISRDKLFLSGSFEGLSAG
jgi:hypothetical protein